MLEYYTLALFSPELGCHQRKDNDDGDDWVTVRIALFCCYVSSFLSSDNGADSIPSNIAPRRPILTQLSCDIVGYIFAVSVDALEFAKCYRADSGNDYCFYTNGSALTLNDAREFCVSKNATLPILTDNVIDSVLQGFIVESFDVIQNRSVWIDAQVRDTANAHWQWTTGQLSGICGNLLPIKSSVRNV